MYERTNTQVNTGNPIPVYPTKPYPSEEMARMVFNEFSDAEQVEIAKQFLSILLDLRSKKYEDLVNEARRIESTAQQIGEGSQSLVLVIN